MREVILADITLMEVVVSLKPAGIAGFLEFVRLRYYKEHSVSESGYVSVLIRNPECYALSSEPFRITCLWAWQ
jgi:hypothetical protein